MNNTTPRTKNYGWLTQSVLQLIIQDGRKSRYEAQKEIKWPDNGYQTEDSRKSTLIPIFNKLLIDEHIGIIDSNPESGGTRIICGLTNKGLDWYVKEYQLTIEELWQISFNFFNKKYHYNDAKEKEKKTKKQFKRHWGTGKKHSILEKKSIDDFFTLFEKNILNISRNHFNPLSMQKIQSILNSVIEKHKTSSEEIVFVLKNIALGKKLELVKKTNDSSYYIINEKKFTIRFIHSLQDDLLIFLKNSYDISIFGILFLLHSLYELKKWEEIDEIILKKKDTLPFVFNHWSELKEKTNLKTERLVEILLAPHLQKTSEIFSYPRNTVESRLIGTQYDLEEFTYSELSREYEIGLEYAKNWAKKKSCFHYLFDENGWPEPRLIPYFGRNFNLIKNGEPDSLRKYIDSAIIDIQKNLHDEMIDSKASQNIFDYFEPLRKLGELHCIISDAKCPEFGMIVNDLNVKSKFNPVQNIITFYFYLLYSVTINEKQWHQILLKTVDKLELRQWWNEWLTTLTKFDKYQSEKIEDFTKLVIV
jgi:hypothetical protein